jgi:transcriptional regulator with XRE-family HTH domain
MPNPAQSPDYREFLDRLRTARVRAKLLQAEVARRLGKPQSYVSKCESGERRVDVIELVAFADIYKRPLTYFLPSREVRSRHRKKLRG